MTGLTHFRCFHEKIIFDFEFSLTRLVHSQIRIKNMVIIINYSVDETSHFDGELGATLQLERIKIDGTSF